MNEYSFEVRGDTPASKGSYRAVDMHDKRGRRVSRLVPMDRKETPWRQHIVNVIHSGNYPRISREYRVTVSETFYMPRPKRMPRRKRFTPNVKPDIDKLERALNDALTDSGIIADDAMITRVNKMKVYAETPEECGVSVELKWSINHD